MEEAQALVKDLFYAQGFFLMFFQVVTTQNWMCFRVLRSQKENNNVSTPSCDPQTHFVFSSQEVGAEQVHPITARVAKIKNSTNVHRDLFRFISLPVDLAWVTCPVYSEPYTDIIVERDLPMYDPHELLEYLWDTKRIHVPTSEIEKLAVLS